MAFAQSKLSQSHDVRTVPLAVTAALSFVKVDGLALLRQQALALATALAEAGFVREPLEQPDLAGLDQRLLKAQHRFLRDEGLSRAYADRVRIDSRAALREHQKRYFRKLLGRLAYVDETIPTALRMADDFGIVRRFYFVPPTVQDGITTSELVSLKALVELPFKRKVQLFRNVVLRGKPGQLSANQVAVLTELHRQVQAKWRPATLGRADRTISFALDANMLPSGDRTADEATRAVAALLADPTNARYRFFLEIAHPVPGQRRLRLPLELPTQLAINLDGPHRKVQVRSFVLVLGPNGAVGVRAVVARKKAKPTALRKVTHLIGRDVGDQNTVTHSVLALPAPLAPARVADLAAMTMAEARTFLSTHAVADEPRFVERIRHSGRAFLACLQRHHDRIGQLAARIETEYQALDAERTALAARLGQVKDAQGRWPPLAGDEVAMGHPDRPALAAFFRRLTVIGELKRARSARYRRVAAVRKNWLGFLANAEVLLALKWNAAVVRENATYVVRERDSADYRGPRVNNHTNWSARGQYATRASNKLAWNGVPEIVLPSYYTSTTCYRHAVVDRALRDGATFSCPQCAAQGRAAEHADEHAADTLALYATLRPIDTVTPAARA